MLQIRQILRYHVPNKLLSPDKFAHHVLLLFYPFREEKELLSGFPPLYRNKLQEKGVQDVANINKINVEPYGNLVNQVFLQVNENLINNQDPPSKLKMMKHQGQNIPMKVIQKKEKQIILHFATSCHKYYQMMKSQKL